MRLFRNVMTALALGSMVVAVPMEAEARKFPKTIKKPKKTSEFKQIKTKLKSFKGQGRTAYNNFKAAYRSERINRQLLERSQFQVTQAQNAYNADRSPQNQAALNNAQIQLRSVQSQYSNALGIYRNAKGEVGRLLSIRNAAVNADRQRQGVRPRPARQARPQFAQNARVQQQRIGASVAPNVNAALNNGQRATYVGQASPPPRGQDLYLPVRDSQMFRDANGGYMVPGPPAQMYGQSIYANPAAFPAAALQQSAPANAQQSQTYEQPNDPL